MKSVLFKNGFYAEVDATSLEDWYRLLDTDLVEVHSVTIKGHNVDIVMSENLTGDEMTTVVDERFYESGRVVPLFRGNIRVIGLPDDEGKGTNLSDEAVKAVYNSFKWIAEILDESIGYQRHLALLASY